MKILLLTLPLREEPTLFPPVAITRLINGLEGSGYNDIDFYNCDYIRPDMDEIIKYVNNSNPDIIGISAVVSTSYSYTKNLSESLRKNFPNTPQIVGGNLAASADVILEYCPVDLCVIGPGDDIIVELCKHFEKFKSFEVNTELIKIKGIVYRNTENDEKFIFSGYATQPIPKNIDWDVLKRYNQPLDFYMGRGDTFMNYQRDPRAKEEHRLGKRFTTLFTTNGCVAKCTFCHRWSKGYQMFEIDPLVKYIKYLMDEYNVGFVTIADENFGSSRKQVEEFCEKIAPLDVLWYTAGVRVRNVDEELIRKMKESGCTTLYYGIESGSAKMLKIMEKNATLELNYKAMVSAQKNDMWTIIQYVIGMPGETNQTINETIEFSKKCRKLFADNYKILLSVNYAQSLPGTPLYEYARHEGFLGEGSDSEEEYLLKISDVDAASREHYINMSEESLIDVMAWQDKIIIESDIYYHINLGKPFVDQTSGDYLQKEYSRGDYFRITKNPKLLKRIIILYSFYCFGKQLYPLLGIYRTYQRFGSIKKTFNIFMYERSREKTKTPMMSLRKIMQKINETKNYINLQPLRDGR